MRFSLLPITLLAIGVLIALVLQVVSPESGPGSPPPAYTLEEIHEIYREGDRLDETHQSVARFSRTLKETISAVLVGSIPLPEAADSLLGAAQTASPHFLKSAARKFPDLAPREQVMHLLLYQMELAREWGQLSIQEAERLTHLQRKYGGRTVGQGP